MKTALGFLRGLVVSSLRALRPDDRPRFEQSADGRLTVADPQGDVTQRIWVAARQQSVGVRSLTRSRNSLEQIFLDAVQEQPDAGA